MSKKLTVKKINFHFIFQVLKSLLWRIEFHIIIWSFKKTKKSFERRFELSSPWSNQNIYPPSQKLDSKKF